MQCIFWSKTGGHRALEYRRLYIKLLFYSPFFFFFFFTNYTMMTQMCFFSMAILYVFPAFNSKLFHKKKMRFHLPLPVCGYLSKYPHNLTAKFVKSPKVSSFSLFVWLGWPCFCRQTELKKICGLRLPNFFGGAVFFPLVWPNWLSRLKKHWITKIS